MGADGRLSHVVVTAVPAAEPESASCTEMRVCPTLVAVRENVYWPLASVMAVPVPAAPVGPVIV